MIWRKGGLGFPRRRAGFANNASGASAVEFALMAPIFALILAGAGDFGGVLYVKLGLDDGVSAAADYALNNASSVSSTSGATLAANLAAILASTRASNWATGTVVVNAGPTATITGGVVASSGTASSADSCYCPTRSAPTVSWGSAVTCGAACSGGGTAGKYVTIVAHRTYSPIFSSYGLVKNGTITASAVVETQ